MSLAIIYVGNIVAIAVLVLGLYFRRHRRRDLVTAYFGVNIGVMAVSAPTTSARSPSACSAGSPPSRPGSPCR